MTFSILALDKKTGMLGCAAATGNLAVGSWVLRATPTGGAVATQGMSVSSLWGDEALRLLSDGETIETIICKLTEPDTGRDYRQLAVLDKKGNGAVWTGDKNTDEKGHIIKDGVVISGNWLSSQKVLAAMEKAYFDLLDTDFGNRLLGVLEAAMEAGSDSRGTYSAAIRIVGMGQAPLDLRVDYDEAPLERLRKLYDMVTSKPYSDWVLNVPTVAEPFKC